MLMLSACRCIVRCLYHAICRYSLVLVLSIGCMSNSFQGKGTAETAEVVFKKEGISNKSLILRAADLKLSGPFQAMLAAVKDDVSKHNPAIDDLEPAILTGCALHNALMKGHKDFVKVFKKTHDQHAQSARALLWFYYALGVHKKQSFSEGTFVVQDSEDYAIFAFLNGCSKAYKRPSTHFKTYSKFAKKQGLDETQRGIDITGLPPCTYKRTVLFGQVDSERHLIFIKPEKYGLSTWWDYAMHSVDCAASLGRKWYYLQFLLGSDDDAGNKKDRIPQKLKNDYSILVKKLEQQGLLSTDHSSTLLQNQADAWGIQKMELHLATYKGKLIQKEHELLHKEVSDMYEVIHKKFDHISMRWGNEVHITKKTAEHISKEDVAAIYNAIKKAQLGTAKT